MKRGVLLAGALAVAAGLAAPRPAEARLIDLYAGATAGGIAGWGTTPKTPDFFDTTRGGGVGFDLGLKLLIFDFQGNFFQTFNGSGASGTLIQFLLGTEVDIPLGDAKLSNGPKEDGKPSDGQSQNVLKPEIAAGFGFGTPGPVSPPLTDSQVSAKGVVANASLGYEHYFNPFLAVGAVGTFGYHYFFGGDEVNGTSGHSSGYHLIGLGTFTFHLGY
ncbi:MAG TPA: hypothetical protein VN853_11550 [Polyangia bacterium]|nr:hypothetical protein [Polyangia bacterium]